MTQMQFNKSVITVVVVLLTISAHQSSPAADAPLKGPKLIMIIRHAEKPGATDGEKDPNLSEQGYKRAAALAKVIPDHFSRPDFLIATRKSKGSNRPVETITPLSKALGEEIEATTKDDDYAEVAKEVLSDPKFDGKTVLIAWHHGKIPELAKALGVTDGPGSWDPNVFDRVWEITFENGKATLKDLPQLAMPGDSQK